MQNLVERLQHLEAEQRAAVLAQLAERGEDFNVYPVSSSQRRLWLLDQMHPGRAVYNVPYAFRLAGGCDVAALDRALAELGRRHESLRTVFLPIDGSPRQAILAEPRYSLVVEDVPVAPHARNQIAAVRAAEEARRPFDLACGPLVRASLVRFDEEDALFLLTLHHIICDGWSMRVLFTELAELYDAYRVGRTPALALVTMQYLDCAQWQTEWLAGPAGAELLEYWTSQLSGAPPLVDLPSDHPRPKVHGGAGGIETFAWPQSLSERLQVFCRANDVTPFMVLLAAFDAVLHRYTGQDDLVVGTAVANRTRVEMEDVVGFFVNTLPLRARIGREEPFRSLLLQVRDTVLGAQSHQELPFEALVDALAGDRAATHAPLVQAVFVLQDGEADELALPGLHVTRIPTHSGTTKFDLILAVTSVSDGIEGWLEYDRELFEPETMQRFLGHVRRLLGAAMRDPDCPVGRLPLLTGAEERQVIRGWNPVREASAGGGLVHELLEAWADATPDAVAAAYGSQVLTYRELDEKANQLAHHLRGLGVGPEVLVGISLDRSLDLLVAMFGVLKSGGAYVPLDPAYPAERLAYMIEDARAQLIVTDSAVASRLPAHAEKVLVDHDREVIAARSVDRPSGQARPENLAYVIYTSGSTGRPKGAMIPHRGVCNLADEQVRALGITADDRVLQFASFSFDASVLEILLGLNAGACVVLAPRHELQPGRDLTRTVRDHAVTATFLPPTVLRLMDPAELPSLSTLVVGGEVCPEEFAAAWAPGRRFFNIYGPTEATIWATSARCSGREQPLPIGRPIRDVQAYVLDDHLQPVPVGVPGELYLGGVGVARGYLGRPELTAERFVPDAFGGLPGARLYRTGDVVRYLADGQLEFLRRADDQVKVRGYRIELGEIQARLSEHPTLRAAVVTTREDDPGDVRLVAYVVPASSQTVDSDALRRWLRQVLPEHMVPAAFVAVDAIPLTPNGKLDFRALPAPEAGGADKAASLKPPDGAMERTIADVWRAVLRVEHVGATDNFFDLGGNSLLLVKARTRLEEVLGRDVATLTLFECPTVRALAERLEQGERADAALAEGERRADGRRLLAERGARRRQAERV